MKFLVTRASLWDDTTSPLEGAEPDGYITHYYPPTSDHGQPHLAWYIHIPTLEALQDLIDNEGKIIIEPLPVDWMSDTECRPYGAQASYELVIYDDNVE